MKKACDGPRGYINGEEIMPGDWVVVTADPIEGGGFFEHSPRILKASEVARLALLDPEIRSLAEQT